MTSCQWNSRAGAFLDQELSVEDYDEFTNHLPSCEVCQKEIQTLETLSRVVENETAFRIPPALKSAIGHIPSRLEKTDLLLTARALAGVAALLLIFSVGFSSKYGEWPIQLEPRQYESLVVEEWDSEVLEEPEAEATHWVVAGLSEKRER